MPTRFSCRTAVSAGPLDGRPTVGLRFVEIIHHPANIGSRDGRVDESFQVLSALVSLRDRARRVLQSQNEGWPDANRQEARSELNRAYDRFVGAYGPINKTTFGETKDGTIIRRMPNPGRVGRRPGRTIRWPAIARSSAATAVPSHRPGLRLRPWLCPPFGGITPLRSEYAIRRTDTIVRVHLGGAGVALVPKPLRHPAILRRIGCRWCIARRRSSHPRRSTTPVPACNH